ncbi:hypothetical protein FGP38_08950 [Salmonella enterica]|nr:hypothetical protein [Salmonella enterica]EBG2007845.1 hypothetical protein [Salmonella enterica]EDQ6089584.1 hypothetical protein [Salmonella enterica]EFP0513042.1 hypothetical protein [Salmonella enterica]EHB3461479.1 hypothetical protein [Salmonella enterica]
MMSLLLTGLIRPPVYTELFQPTDSDNLFRPAVLDALRGQTEPENKTPVVHTFRLFRVELKSVTRRGNRVRSIYYVKDSHILAARDAAVRTAGKRGLREIRVVKVTDPLLQA